MKGFKYLPLKWVLYGMSYLPFWALYGIADFLFVVLRYVVRYRYKVVSKNINESFPDKIEKERKIIIRKFYRQFADYFVETIKLNHISDEQMRRRVTFDGVDVIDEMVAEGKSVVVYLSHCGNWEWIPSITLWTRHEIRKDLQFCQVYRPLKNEWFDKYFLHLRSRFNSLSFQKRTVLRDLLRLRRDNMPSVTGFMSDQKPSKGDEQYVTMFLNHPTAIITGTETIARKLQMGVVYLDIKKPRRGHYHVSTQLITKDASKEPEMSITAIYARLLEQTIIDTPHIWLWSHKRWKNKVTLPPATNE